MRRTIGSLVLAVVVVACSSRTPGSEPASAGAPSSPPTPMAVASATTKPPVSASPSAPPSSPASNVPAGTLSIQWSADDPVGVSPVQSIIGVARTANAYVLVTELAYRGEETPFAAWWSTDGRTWQLAQEFPAGERMMSLTAGGPGFVVAGFDNDGATVWTSADGRAWRSVVDPSLHGGVIRQLIPTARGIVGFGQFWANDAEAIWTSPDGIEWLAATNATGLTVARGLQAVGSYDGRAVAFVEEAGTKGLAVWETTGRAEWTRVGSVPDGAMVQRVAGGPRGWVAVGSSKAWTSSNGRAWSRGVSGPDVAADVIADGSGFVAVGWVGSLPGETCGDQRPFAGHTWTSADGSTWEQMPGGEEFSSAMVTNLIVVDRTLVGYGQRLGDLPEAMAVGRWTASLPDVAHPANASDEASLPKTCGG
jgi:hypothetical protein